MKHLGDITKINGTAVEPVEVIIGGSPCQDLSVAGKRAGLNGERSGLFMEQIRIIKEMRSADERNGATHIRPRYMVWENVPGAFSSNKGEDFRIVLEETARVCDPTAVIPRPKKGKWTNAGAIMGDGWSIAWRVHDAQFWGVPQRRRRIALVADFGGESAPEILFERESVSGDITQSGTPWKDFAVAIAERFGGANQAERESGHLTFCIQGNSIDHADTAGCNGKGVKEGVSYTLNTIDRHAVSYNGSTITSEINHQNPKVGDPCHTLTNDSRNYVVAYDARGNGEGRTVPTITGDHENRVTDYTALCVRERCGCDGGGKGLLIQKDKSGTLAAKNDQFTVCIGNGQSNSLKPTEKVGAVNCMHDQQAIITLDRAAFNQGENAQYDFKVDDKGANSTIVSKGPSAVCSQSSVRRLTPLECERLQGFPDDWTLLNSIEDMTMTEYEFWKNLLFEKAIREGKARQNEQGEYEVWREVKTKNDEGETESIWENTHKPYKHKTKDQMIKWYNRVFTNDADGVRYKALGNSIAIPPWLYVLSKLSLCCGEDHTMASLFDGIGGFPLIWQELGGQCLWASEIEEFCIAVTKYHFGEE